MQNAFVHFLARARDIGLGQNFFIAFLDELGNFKHFETYFFLAIFGPKIADLAIASAIMGQNITNLAI